MDLMNEKPIKLRKKEFSKIISDYYQKKYNIIGTFDFLPIIYEYIDEKNVSNKKVAHAHLPCLIDKNSYGYYKARNIVIRKVIRLEELDEAVKQTLPREIIYISNLEIIQIFRELGYTQPLYNLFQDLETGELDYTVTIRQIDQSIKTKVL